MWTWLSRTAVAAPRRVIVGAALVVVVAAPGLLRIAIRTDGLALVPPHAPEIETDRDVRAQFGVADQIVVVVRTRDRRGIFNPETLRRVAELTRRLEQLPGVGPGRVQSLANESSDRVYTGTLTFRPWLDPLPASDEELERLRRNLVDLQVYTGTLISTDPTTSATAILVDVERDLERGALYRRIRDAVSTEASASDDILVVGAPVAESQLGDHLIADLATLIPISVAVLIIVFYATFRSWPLVLLPLAEVGAAIVFTFAVMGWLDVPVYLTVAILPVILTMIGVTDELHMFTHLQSRLRADVDAPQPQAVLDTMDELAAPVAKASLTTAVGFLSFVASSIEPVRVFGLFMALGVSFCMLWSLTVIPASLALIPARRLRRSTSSPWRMDALARWVLRRRAGALATAAVLLVVAPVGIVRVHVQDSWIEGFAATSEFRRSTAEVDRLFGGTHILRLAIDGPRLLEPAALARIGGLERFVGERRGEGVGRVLGPYEHLATMRYMLHLRRDGERRAPDTPEETALVVDHYRLVRGERRLREIFDPSFDAGLAAVFLKSANFVDTARLMHAVRDYERQELTPHGVSVRFAGDVAASQAMIEAIVGTQLSSVLLSLVGIGALTCWLFSSLVWGLLCVVPAALGVLGIFAVMGFAGIPLGVATSMFAATVLCVGDDYAIHLVEAARRRLDAGYGVDDAITDAIATTAPAILLDGFAIAAAFGVLCFSRVPPNTRLGALVVASIAVCVVATLGVLPALMRWAAHHAKTAPFWITSAGRF